MEKSTIEVQGGSMELRREKHDLASNDSRFSPIDQNDFDESCDQKTLKAVTDDFQNGALKPCDMVPVYLIKDGASGLYAKRIRLPSGKSEVVLVYYRSDGRCSEEISIPNSELFTIARAYCDASTAEAKREGKKAAGKVTKKLLEYWDGEVLFNTGDVISSLIEQLPSLPVDTTRTLDIKVVYARIVNKVENMKNHPGYTWISRRGYYAFWPDQFQEVAEEMAMKPKELALYLKQYGLLYLQNSSVGYQCNVKGVGNCYCVKTLRKFQTEEVEEVNGDARALL